MRTENCEIFCCENREKRIEMGARLNWSANDLFAFSRTVDIQKREGDAAEGSRVPRGDGLDVIS